MEKNSTETAKARVRLGRGNSNKFDRQVREKNNGEKRIKTIKYDGGASRL